MRRLGNLNMGFVFNFVKLFNIWFVRFLLSLKQIKEYKANFLSVLLFDLILFFSTMLFYTIFLGDVSSDILGWGINEFVLLFCFGLLGGKFTWMFNLFGFSGRLLSGELNLYLVRPVNAFFMAATSKMSGANFVTSVFLFLFSLIWLFINDFKYILLVVVLMVFGWFMYSTLYCFMESISFFLKDNTFIMGPLKRVNYMLQFYTISFFENSRAVKVFALFPCVLYSYIPIEVARGNLEVLNLYLLPLVLSFLGMVLSIYFMWKFGLKNYEAFG